MRKSGLLAVMAVMLWAAGCATTNNSQPEETFRTEEQLESSKLNNRRLEKNLDKFAAELNLSNRQQKQLKRIDRKYARLERKIKRKDGNQRRNLRRLDEEKRKEMIDVLTAEQEDQLQALAKKGRFSLDQIFGR